MPLSLLFTVLLSLGSTSIEPSPSGDLKLPYAAAGWTDREAAAFLANRFTFGSTPELVDEIVRTGPADWVEQQLNPRPRREFEREMRAKYPALQMDAAKMVRKYPAPAIRLIYTIVRAKLKKVDYSAVTENAGALNEKLDVLVEDVLTVQREDRPLFAGLPQLQRILDKQEYGDFNQLMYQLMAHKFERALHSENQLEEVLTDFWFNHFNVSLTRVNDTAPWVPSYERDAIRPFVFGNFGEMLKTTARHPAMLSYLDNVKNNPEANAPTLIPQQDQREKFGDNYENLKDFIDQPGINENYAREIMELHTLGVDGGYTQADVEELARILTGWKIPVTSQPLPGIIRAFVSLKMKRQKKSVVEPTFYFNPEWHDAGVKQFLGTTYPAGQGLNEGQEAIARLAAHPATATFISTKLARRFTTAEPDPGLVAAMAETFRTTGGDLRAVMRKLVSSPAFWRKDYVGEKLKQPFHFVVASLRRAGSRVEDPIEPLRWCTRLGQPLYACQPPTGYPDSRAFWATGSGILRRMDFAEQLVNGKISGVGRPSTIDPETLILELAGPEFQNY